MKFVSHRRMLSLACAMAGILALPGIAAAQSKVYAPGTDCANQPTIAERLLCGRQEFRRQQGSAVEQPTVVSPTPQGGDDPFPAAPTPPTELNLAPDQVQSLPRTSSPNH